jgi:hypothetical protein
MKNFKFYYNWLIAVMVAMIATGIYMAFFNQSEFFIFRYIVNTPFWGIGKEPDIAALHFQGFIYGLTGAVMIAWCSLMLMVIKHAFKKQQLWAWQAILVSVLAWFQIDEIVSIYYKVYLNAIFNLLLLLLIIIPLMLSRKYFK